MKQAGAIILASLLITGAFAAPAGAVRGAHHWRPLPVRSFPTVPSFEENLGQAPAGVDFLARGEGHSLYLTANGATLTAQGEAPITLRYAGSRHDARPQGVDRLAGTVNYLIGRDPRRWHTDIQTFGAVRYRNLYPGIDLLYHGSGRGLEYDWVVQPGTNPAAIHLQVEARGRVGLDARGDLALGGGRGALVQSAPTVYQEEGGARQVVSSRYSLRPDGTIGISVGRYDSHKPLVIDPVLQVATYLGGANVDHAYEVDTDSQGNIFVTGDTLSANFPSPHGGGPPHLDSTTGDAFIMKLSPFGDTLLFTTFIGGSGVDESYRVAVDAADEATIAGETISKDFPLEHPFQPAYGGGGSDGFITRLNSRGDGLLYSSYAGGSGDDFASALALDAHGAAYVTGDTHSADFPLLHAFQPRLGGGADAFVLKVDPVGALQYSTFLGGNSVDTGNGIAVDGDGNAYIAGVTYSTKLPLVHPIPYPYYGGFDGFVAKIDSTGQRLLFCSYLGGGDTTFADDITLDAAGAVYVAGQTNSPYFPLVNPWQRTYGGGSDMYFSGDAFLLKISPDLTHLVYSTFLGGKGDDAASALAVTPAGSATVTGYTNSPNFPARDAFQPRFIGATCHDLYATFPCNDGFVATFTPLGRLAFSTFLGGSQDDVGTGIVLAPAGRIVSVGNTDSTDFHTVHALQPNNMSTPDAGTDTYLVEIAPGRTRMIEPLITLDGVQLIHTVRGKQEPTDTLQAGEPGQFEVRYHIAAGGKYNPSVTLQIRQNRKVVLRSAMAAGTTAAGIHVFRANVRFPGLTSIDRLVAQFKARLGTARDSRSLTFSVSPRP